jgi:hypothetical protein
MGKSTISMAIFNSYVKLPEGNHWYPLIKFFLSKDVWLAMLRLHRYLGLICHRASADQKGTEDIWEFGSLAGCVRERHSDTKDKHHVG